FRLDRADTQIRRGEPGLREDDDRQRTIDAAESELLARPRDVDRAVDDAYATQSEHAAPTRTRRRPAVAVAVRAAQQLLEHVLEVPAAATLAQSDDRLA